MECKRKHVELEPNVSVRSKTVSVIQKLNRLDNNNKMCMSQRQSRRGGNGQLTMDLWVPSPQVSPRSLSIFLLFEICYFFFNLARFLWKNSVFASDVLCYFNEIFVFFCTLGNIFYANIRLINLFKQPHEASKYEWIQTA